MKHTLHQQHGNFQARIKLLHDIVLYICFVKILSLEEHLEYQQNKQAETNSIMNTSTKIVFWLLSFPHTPNPNKSASECIWCKHVLSSVTHPDDVTHPAVCQPHP